MSAARYDFAIDQGAYWELTFTWKDADDVAINNTGYEFTLEAKDTTTGEDVIDLGPVSGVTLGGADGKVTFFVPDETTAGYDFNALKYDIEYNPPSGKKKRLMWGYITLSKDVT